MAAISTYSIYADDQTPVQGAAISSSDEKTHRENVRNLHIAMLAIVADLEDCYAGTSDPTDAVTGKWYFNETNGVHEYYTGAAWIPLLTQYVAVNDANPQLRIGAADAEELHIQTVYDSGAQTLDYVLFQTDAASATADKGEFRFNVDGTLIATIDDGGLELAASMGLMFGAVTILSDSAGTTTLSNIDAIDATTEATIEAAIDTLSNLTTVGALASGSIASGFGSIATLATLTIGADTDGYDVKIFNNAAGSFSLFDESADKLELRGATAAGPGSLLLSTGEADVVATNVLGEVLFQAPVDGAGGDAILVAAAIRGVAADTFSSSVNKTDIVFYTAQSETATEKLRLMGDGTLRLVGTTSGAVGFKPAATAGSVDYTLPSADGSSGHALTTNGSGTLSWAAGSADFNDGGDTAGADRTLGNNDTYKLHLETDGSTAMTLDSDQQIGIGVDPPLYRVHVDNDDAISMHMENGLSTGKSFDILMSHASYAGDKGAMQCRATRSGTSAMYLASMMSGGTGDNEFVFRGDGEGQCDGSWTGGGADYAEFFEWHPSEVPNVNDDLRGITVWLDGDKIKKTTVGTDPAKIIGVVSVNPTVIGNTAQLKWQHKYLRDDYGGRILADEKHYSWEENGETVWYREDLLPGNAPAEKTLRIDKVRTPNPAYDPNVEYVPREKRLEWVAIGLMGQMNIKKGQKVHDRWLLMKDANASANEYLIR